MAKRTVRPYRDRTPAQIADMIGALDVQLRELGSQMKSLKAEFAERKLTCVDGEAFRVLRSDVLRTLVDLDALREAAPELVAQFERESHSTKFTIRPSERLAQAA